MGILILLAVCSGLILLTGCYRASSRGQTICEVSVDAMYGVAAVMYAMAQACDAAIVRYRTARQEIRDVHVPMYAEVR